jgi:hypothetical protein
MFHMVINLAEGATVAYAWDYCPQQWANASFSAELMRSRLYGYKDDYKITMRIVELLWDKHFRPDERHGEAEKGLCEVGGTLYGRNNAYAELMYHLGWTVDIEPMFEENNGAPRAREHASILCPYCLQPLLWGFVCPVTANEDHKICFGCFYQMYVGFSHIRKGDVHHDEGQLATVRPLTMPKVVVFKDVAMVALWERFLGSSDAEKGGSEEEEEGSRKRDEQGSMMSERGDEVEKRQKQ